MERSDNNQPEENPENSNMANKATQTDPVEDMEETPEYNQLECGEQPQPPNFQNLQPCLWYRRPFHPDPSVFCGPQLNNLYPGNHYNFATIQATVNHQVPPLPPFVHPSIQVSIFPGSAQQTCSYVRLMRAMTSYADNPRIYHHQMHSEVARLQNPRSYVYFRQPYYTHVVPAISQVPVSERFPPSWEPMPGCSLRPDPPHPDDSDFDDSDEENYR